MINQLHDSDEEHEKYVDKVHEILTIEGGAAGLSALKPAFPKKTSKKKAESMLAKMAGVVQHADGDYILVTELSNPTLTRQDYHQYLALFRQSKNNNTGNGWLPPGTVIESWA